MKKVYKGLFALIFSLCFSRIFAFVVIFLIPKNTLNSIPNVVIYVVSDIIFISILYSLYKNELKKEWIIFKEKWKDLLEDNLLYWVLGTVLSSLFNIIITILIAQDMPENEQLVREMMKVLPFYMIFSTTIVAPFAEELIYRKSVRDIVKNKYVYMGLSGLLFGLAHVIFSYTTMTDLLYIIPYGVLGVAFAYMYEKTKTIFTPMAFHFIHNAGIMIIGFIVSLIGK